jgi:hypothetical protein
LAAGGAAVRHNALDREKVMCINPDELSEEQHFDP